VTADGRREHRIVRIDGDERRWYTLPITGEFTVMDNDAEPVYVESGGSIAAFDPVTGGLHWHHRVSDGPVRILGGRPGGGVIASGNGRWIVLDSSGARVEADLPLPGAGLPRP
jgi:hypothetical protein